MEIRKWNCCNDNLIGFVIFQMNFHLNYIKTDANVTKYEWMPGNIPRNRFITSILGKFLNNSITTDAIKNAETQDG